MSQKIKIILSYEYSEIDEGLDFFNKFDGNEVGEMMAQESGMEIINNLDENAIAQLVDENGKVLKQKNIKINF